MATLIIVTAAVCVLLVYSSDAFVCSFSLSRQVQFLVCQRTQVFKSHGPMCEQTVGQSDDSCLWLPRASVPLDGRTAPSWLTRAQGRRPENRAKVNGKNSGQTLSLFWPPVGCPLVARSGPGALGSLSWVGSCASSLFLFFLIFLFGRCPKERSLPACDRGRHIPAPGREGRRVKAGAPTQEPVISGIPCCNVFIALFFHNVVFMTVWRLFSSTGPWR